MLTSLNCLQIYTYVYVRIFQYPDLFSQCPLRLRSGLLLYGAPGTGKTLIAGIVAKETNLNFIVIKVVIRWNKRNFNQRVINLLISVLIPTTITEDEQR